MPKILNDERDPVKRAVGIKLKELVEQDKQDGGSRFTDFLYNSGLKDHEILELQHDPEYWIRDSQWFDMSDPCPMINIFCGGRGAGKLLAKSTPIFTANKGWTTVGEVEVGDYVFGEDGLPTEVIDYQEDDPEKCYEIEFDTGEKIVVDSRHLWNTWTHKDRKQYGRLVAKGIEKPNPKFYFPEVWYNWRSPHRVKSEPDFGPRVRTTQEIYDTFRQGIARGDLNHSIPVARPLKIDHKPVPVDPYVLGCWLGDGSRGSGGFTSIDLEIIENIRAAGYVVSDHKERKAWHILGLTGQLRDLGVLHDKHIPEIYLNNSEEVRLELLRGLMDTDGYADIRDERLVVEFCQAGKNTHLAHEVVKLASSFGEKVTWAESDAKLYGRVTSRRVRVCWKPNNVNPFRISRKYDLISEGMRKNSGKGNAARNKHRMLVGIKEVPTPEEGLRCLTVDNDSSLFLVGETMIPTHNSFSLGAHVYRMVEKHGLKDIVVICRTSRDIRTTIRNAIFNFYYEGHPNMPTFNKHNGEITYPNGAKILNFSGEMGEDSVRGINAEAVLVDELAFLGNNEGILDNAMLGLRKEPSIFLGFTSPWASKHLVEWHKRWEDGDEDIRILTGSSRDNLENLSNIYKGIIKSYEGTTIGQREIEGKLILENPAALVQMSDIENVLVRESDLPDILEWSIGADPAIIAKSGSRKGRTPDNTGLVVAGKGADGYLYIVDNFTGSYNIEGWTTKLAELYDHYSKSAPTKIKIEINAIGEGAIGHVFKSIGRYDVFRAAEKSFSTLSKLERFQPHALKIQQGRIKIVDKKTMGDMIQEMVTFTGQGKKSPDHLDAAVFALDLIDPINKKFTKVYDLVL